MGDGVHAAVASSSSSEATIHAIEPLETTASGLDGTDGEADSLTEHDDDLEADDDGDDAPTPRFMQDEGAWKHWRWVPYPARRFATAVVRWSRGPADARAFAIKPFFPAVQRAPIALLECVLDELVVRVGGPRWLWRRVLFFAYMGLWALTFALVLRRGLAAAEVPGWGTPTDIGCGNTYWVAGNQCGLDGSDCRPFSDSGFAFRCPASCESYIVLNPRAVGSQEIVYTPLVIGGPGSAPEADHNTSAVYRGDSFLCAAAIHAGVVTNAAGGCGVVELVGQQHAFAASHAHGIRSVAFDSYFPLAFRFAQDITCPAHDARWPLLTVSVVFSVVLSLFTASPAPFFWGSFTGIFWTVGLATDPLPSSSTAGLLSDVVGHFLPAALGAWVIFDRAGVRRTLTGLTAQVEKTVLWLGACWVGALTNYTFDYIPIQRLTPHDLQQQPGAKAALAIIISVLIAIFFLQVWFFRQEGRLRRHLLLYFFFVSSLFACMALPSLKLRIHHYILALLLLPGTSMQTRPCLLFQGLLVGFYINGTCRWGFASLLQTQAALQGDAQLGSPLPQLVEPIVRIANATAAAAIEAVTSVTAAAIVANTSSITFSWMPPPAARYDGISVLVNDVERHRAFFADGPDASLFVWERPAAAAGLDEYFRFAFMEGSDSGDYTKAGIWTAAGDWMPMAAGPSRVRSRSLDGETLTK